MDNIFDIYSAKVDNDKVTAYQSGNNRFESHSVTLSLLTFALYISKRLSILFGHYFGNEKLL